MKMAESSPKGEKTVWEKEKLLVTSNFSFTHSFQKACTADTLKPGLVWEWARSFPCMFTTHQKQNAINLEESNKILWCGRIDSFYTRQLTDKRLPPLWTSS